MIVYKQGTNRSLSSAAWEASDSLAVAEPKRSSERSKSSSSNWMRRFNAATSDSAYKTNIRGLWILLWKAYLGM